MYVRGYFKLHNIPTALGGSVLLFASLWAGYQWAAQASPYRRKVLELPPFFSSALTSYDAQAPAPEGATTLTTAYLLNAITVAVAVFHAGVFPLYQRTSKLRYWDKLQDALATFGWTWLSFHHVANIYVATLLLGGPRWAAALSPLLLLLPASHFALRLLPQLPPSTHFGLGLYVHLATHIPLALLYLWRAVVLKSPWELLGTGAEVFLLTSVLPESWLHRDRTALLADVQQSPSWLNPHGSPSQNDGGVLGEEEEEEEGSEVISSGLGTSSSGGDTGDNSEDVRAGAAAANREQDTKQHTTPAVVSIRTTTAVQETTTTISQVQEVDTPSLVPAGGGPEPTGSVDSIGARVAARRGGSILRQRLSAGATPLAASPASPPRAHPAISDLASDTPSTGERLPLPPSTHAMTPPTVPSHLFPTLPAYIEEPETVSEPLLATEELEEETDSEGGLKQRVADIHRRMKLATQHLPTYPMLVLINMLAFFCMGGLMAITSAPPTNVVRVQLPHLHAPHLHVPGVVSSAYHTVADLPVSVRRASQHVADSIRDTLSSVPHAAHHTGQRLTDGLHDAAAEVSASAQHAEQCVAEGVLDAAAHASCVAQHAQHRARQSLHNAAAGFASGAHHAEHQLGAGLQTVEGKVLDNIRATQLGLKYGTEQVERKILEAAAGGLHGVAHVGHAFAGKLEEGAEKVDHAADVVQGTAEHLGHRERVAVVAADA